MGGKIVRGMVEGLMNRSRKEEGEVGGGEDAWECEWTYLDYLGRRRSRCRGRP